VNKKLSIYVPNEMWTIADDRPSHFLAHVGAAFQGVGFQVSFIDATDDGLLVSFDDDVYCLFYRNRPNHAHALEVRPAPFGPFWMIEKTAKPAQKLVFKRAFEPESVDKNVADGLFTRLADRHLKAEVSAGGYVLVALQGVIGRRRFWQSMSPVEMVQTTIEQEQARKILIKLHPREVYSTEDMNALNALVDGDRVQIVQGDLDALLAGCGYTVSMNSTVSFKGLLNRKPGVLFGDAEFNHVFQKVRSKDVVSCFVDVMDETVDFEKYVYWYLRRQHLWNFKPSIQDDILRGCRVMGWEL